MTQCGGIFESMGLKRLSVVRALHRLSPRVARWLDSRGRSSVLKCFLQLQYNARSGMTELSTARCLARCESS